MAVFRGWWRRVPVFCCYLAAQLPLLIGYRPESSSWLLSVWVPLEPVVVVLRVTAAIEAFVIQRTERGWILGLSLAAVSLALLFIVWATLPSGAQPVIVHLRRYAQIWAAAFLLLYTAMTYSRDLLVAGWKARHLLVLLIILLNHAAVSVASLRGAWADGWWIASPISFGVAIAGYLTWVAVCPVRADPPASPTR